MEKVLPSLDAFSDLEHWFHNLKHVPSYAENLPVHLTWDICRSLQAADREAYLIWKKTLNNLMTYTNEIKNVYLDIEAFLYTKNFNLPIFCSDIGIVAVSISQGEEYQQIIMSLADATQISAFRFISAWLALNTNQLKLCIEECEKIDEPNHSIYTLSGQAQLELGYISEAIEDLNLACQLNPNEVLTWFQLTKAYLINEQLDKAWNAGIECLRLAPISDEVKLLLCFIALKDTSKIDRAQLVWQELMPTLEQYPDSEPVVLNLMELACHSNQKVWAEIIITKTEWKNLKQSQLFMKQLGPILRALGKHQWFDLSAQLLNSMELDKLDATG